MNTVDVVATQFGRFYQLEINGVSVAQTDQLINAKFLVRQYLDTVEPFIDHSGWGVRVSVDDFFEDLYDYPSGG